MNFISRMRIGSRLAVAFFLVTLIGGLIGLAGIISLSRINDLNDQLYQKELLGISYIKEANINLVAAGRARSNYRLAESEEERNQQKSAFDARIKELNNWLGQARPLLYTAEAQKMLTDLDRSYAEWEKSTQTFFQMANTSELMQENAELSAAAKRARTLNNTLDQIMNDLVKAKEKLGADAATAVTVLYERIRALLIGLAIFGVAIGALLGWLITRSITHPLRRAMAAADRVAQGDLTGHIDTSAKDETGDLMRALKKMNESLIHMVRDVRSGCESIALASSQISEGNNDLSQRTEEQASSLQETAASMEEITSTVQQNAQNSKQANELVEEASNFAVKGGEVVSSVVDTMSSISDSSRHIAEITSVIDTIAFQTNILALNAAVEAARAGEQGRGFAVVASEVRSLAQRSAVAAKEIKALIDQSVARVDTGNEQVINAGKTMEQIVTSVRRVSSLVSEIAAASDEQASGIGQINVAVAQMDSVTQQNAALVEEAAAAAASLSDQAEKLTSQVRRFKLAEDRDTASGNSAHRQHMDYAGSSQFLIAAR